MSKIVKVKCWTKNLELSKPYEIAFKRVDSVVNLFVYIELDNGVFGIGAGAPAEMITGESFDQSFNQLEALLPSCLIGKDVRSYRALIADLSHQLIGFPASLAAADIALHDLYSKYLNLPLYKTWGKVHHSLPTSVTIGILSLEETLAEAKSFLDSGFKVIKLKTGHEVTEDIEKFRALRAFCGPEIKIRVDANQGYSVDELITFIEATKEENVEFIEQPIPGKQLYLWNDIPPEFRRNLAADEDLQSLKDASLLAANAACGIFNIKLMKCGGLEMGYHIAQIAASFGIDLMWGCMDESMISISAALHLAFSCPNTKYIDLDGSFDLKKDIVEGGFILEEGYMRPLDENGLGVSLNENIFV